MAQHCEAVCARLRADVFDLPLDALWQPKCRVVLHASRETYRRAVGSGGSQTVGSSIITFAGGRVAQRRIDLLAASWEQALSALPHEMVHVLFADACPQAPPPKWAEEGLALLFDPADKRARHERDLATALQTRTALSLDRLLADVDYPSPANRAAFYGQSLSLVSYLTETRSPKEFVQFAQRSVDRGAKRALTEVYQMDARDLERDWRDYVTATPLATAH